MTKQVKKFYRFLAWFFSIVIAAGTLIGCGGETKYGPPAPKYGPPVNNYGPTSTKYGPPAVVNHNDQIKGNGN